MFDHSCTRSRRRFLRTTSCGFGLVALADLCTRAAAAEQRNPQAAKPPHFLARAKRVIFMFMAGGPSQVETFDPKPLLNQLHGQPRPASFGEGRYQFIRPDARLLGTTRMFAKHGQCGTEVSNLFPHMAQHMDNIAVLRSCHGDMVVHSAAQYELFSGRTVLLTDSSSTIISSSMASRPAVS